MSTQLPTPEEARAALADVESRSLQVRRQDRQLAVMLAAIAAAYLAVAILMSLSPHSGSAFAAIGIIAVLAATIAVAVIVGLRIRAYSRRGIALYFGTIIAFNVCNSIATSVSIGTRFWASNQPSYHFGITVGIATIPLLIGTWLICRRR